MDSIKSYTKNLFLYACVPCKRDNCEDKFYSIEQIMETVKPNDWDKILRNIVHGLT